ncbi:cell division protein FtsQ/DivIB [Lysinibacillus sp. LZ02]|uniref:cell division protein FtsQ/DivIB n=1 Tax=Lysinibacillus sp. LZ02 TaxID=3420668 RepID=UPI003D35E814
MEKVIDLEDRIPTFRQKRRKRTNFKFILLTTIFLFLLLLLLYFQSPYSEVKTIDISGHTLVDRTYYEELSEIKLGDSMWGIDGKEIEAKMEALDWVKKVSVQRKWLTTVVIEIEEWKKVAYLAKDNTFYPMLENGVLYEEANELLPIDAPIFLAFNDEDLRKRLLKELAKLKPEVLALISQINATSSASDPYAITLFMNDGYEVRADITSLASKLNYYPSIIAQIENEEQFEKGIIDIEVGSYYRPYTEEYTAINFEEDVGEQDVMEDEEQSSQ